MEREKSVLVPRFLQQSRDPRVTEIKDGTEACIVVERGKNAEHHWNSQKVDKDGKVFARFLCDRLQGGRLRRDMSDQEINEDRQREDDFRPVANREREERSSPEWPKINQNKIQRRNLAKESEAKRNLPRAAKAEIAPAPRPKNRD